LPTCLVPPGSVCPPAWKSLVAPIRRRYNRCSKNHFPFRYLVVGMPLPLSPVTVIRGGGVSVLFLKPKASFPLHGTRATVPAIASDFPARVPSRFFPFLQLLTFLQTRYFGFFWDQAGNFLTHCFFFCAILGSFSSLPPPFTANGFFREHLVGRYGTRVSCSFLPFVLSSCFKTGHFE